MGWGCFICWPCDLFINDYPQRKMLLLPSTIISCFIYLKPLTTSSLEANPTEPDMEVDHRFFFFLFCAFDLGKVWIKKKWLIITWLLLLVSEEHSLSEAIMNQDSAWPRVHHTLTPTWWANLCVIWLVHVCYLVHNRSHSFCKWLKLEKHMDVSLTNLTSHKLAVRVTQSAV